MGSEPAGLESTMVERQNIEINSMEGSLIAKYKLVEWRLSSMEVFHFSTRSRNL